MIFQEALRVFARCFCVIGLCISLHVSTQAQPARALPHTLAQALETFSANHQVGVLYDTALVAGKNAHCTRQEADVARQLACLLEGTGLAYQQLRTGTFLLVAAPDDLPRSSAWVQAAGHVTGTDGLPLIGASVQWEDHDVGVATDAAGRFTLSLKPGDVVLQVRHIGYKTQAVVLDGGALNEPIRVVLEPEALPLRPALEVVGERDSVDLRSPFFHLPKRFFLGIEKRPLGLYGPGLAFGYHFNATTGAQINFSIDDAHVVLMPGAVYNRLFGTSAWGLQGDVTFVGQVRTQGKAFEALGWHGNALVFRQFGAAERAYVVPKVGVYAMSNARFSSVFESGLQASLTTALRLRSLDQLGRLQLTIGTRYNLQGEQGMVRYYDTNQGRLATFNQDRQQFWFNVRFFF